MSNTIQIYQARRQERLLIEQFLLFVASREGKPRVALCEQRADLLAGPAVKFVSWHPCIESHTELINQFQGINAEQLEAERAAESAAGSDCPCEREAT